MLVSIIIALTIALGRMLAGAILLTAGIAKFRAGTDRFNRAILGYDLVSGRIAWILARWLPWLEVAVGGLLVFGFLTQIASLIAFALLLLFSTVIAVSLLQSRDNDCGCFGSLLSEQKVQWRLVYRNLALMAVLLVVYAFDTLDISTPFFALAIVWIMTIGATVLMHLYVNYANRRITEKSGMGAR